MNEAEEAKREGMAQVENGANEEWMALMYRLGAQTANEMIEFTSDDIIDRYLAAPEPKPTTHDWRAMGPVLSRLARDGFCRKTDRTIPSRRRSLHASPRAVWIGKGGGE